ncbi:cellobiose phosphorylase [Luteibacter rhizovicinus]|uniref:Cellobiose phosphorylase n=1 Tax=Luteibacter rhizovicinus TaxID=242606 RepID=A0A4R3YWV3_9GAMM|nr:glucoamylase family protein [Luteibacter rhizovicinus]TCV97645.1 cellobiose phosphorylase [Luteibacter rhizovicinus]
MIRDVLAWFGLDGASKKRRRTLERRAKGESEPALRSELFNADQLEAHGQTLALQHELAAGRLPERLLTRLADNEQVLLDACQRLTSASRFGPGITPAGEWLLDNLYLIEEQVRIARLDFPKGYSRELPRLANGPSQGLPRVYDIALEVISHGDGRIDIGGLNRFIGSYQRVTPLKLGELWAIPIMLRLALIENLRRVAVRVMVSRTRRRRAARWADAMTDMAGRDPKNVVLVVADMARSNPVMSAPFVAELARRLQGQGPALALPLSWVEQRLAESGQSVEHLVQVESQQQAADQVSIGNSIGSLRALAMIDWRDFVERASLVEQRLREDPATIYMAMDFATRDRYRHVVERLARQGKRSEVDTAQAVLDMCRMDRDGESVPLRRHVGYFLMDGGRVALERQLGIRPRLADSLRRVFDQAPLPIFLGLLFLLTVALTRTLVATAALVDVSLWIMLPLGLAAFVVASQLALSLINWVATLTVVPELLPRMDYAKGIPADARTMVAVPSLIGSIHDVEDLVEALEVRFLANRDDCLHFALLTDFTDADTQVVDGDEAILQRARLRIDGLNDRHATHTVDRFFLFHRPREWSETEQAWIGRDRKRGKLADLNALLRGEGSERFVLIAGDVAALPHVRYVITLDTDTQLPRDTACLFVGAMDHPLNRAVYDASQGRVVSGYGILQPRVGISLSSSARSRYAHLYGADAGIDPYTRAVSDVYQDLFREGSFIGKGIYDIDAFESTLRGRLPNERILSHDLIEGCYARSGLLSDVQLFEEYPARYAVDAKRRHRWIRGDWQLLPWLLPWAPTEGGRWRKNALTALSRWKIFDNLRRSVVPPVVVALLVGGWLGIAPVLAWTLSVLSMVFIPVLLSALLDVVQKPRGVQLNQHLHAALRSVGQHISRVLLTISWLPHEAFYGVDAMARTLWRMGISHRHLLEWQASVDVERRSKDDRNIPWRSMWIGPVLSVLTLLALAVTRPMAMTVALPVLALWFVSPPVAWWMSQARTTTPFAPTTSQRNFLRALARRTWAFFDTHVGPADHWLPPDNLQMVPDVTVAHRTSPTNMGMALLANLAAWDFGFIATERLLKRTQATLSTMQALARHRGHFYNWYDTLTLEPLRPLYVSSVDSGNLAGHLLTLQPGLLAILHRPVFESSALTGLLDTLHVLEDYLTDDGKVALSEWMHALSVAIGSPPAVASDVLSLARTQVDRLDALGVSVGSDASDDAVFWMAQLSVQCTDMLTEAQMWNLDPVAEGTTTFVGIPTTMQLARIEPLCWPGEANAEAVRERAHARIAALDATASMAGELASMDFRFLYDSARHLLSIGYDVEQRRLDGSFYDLLASEARLASFVAISQGQIPQDNWFSLGRLLTTSGGEPVLLSWTGSMFEYLMPMLVMPNYEGTLLDQTCRAAVTRQIEYGNQLGVPWGVSESGYNAIDAQQTYQYRAFGVPGLGLKRGLGDDLVVAPYACALAMMVDPTAATANLQRLALAGMAGRFGLYEAVDYTPARLPVGQDAAIVRSFMAHHQGMSLLALGHALLGQPMQRRFDSDPRFRATSLLLQERVPRTAVEYLHAVGFPDTNGHATAPEPRLRLFTNPDRPRPAVQLLSNGRYHVMVSSAGGGYSRRQDLAVTRWREDITRDNWGMFCYIRDVSGGEFWSTAYQPAVRKTELYEAIFSDARAEFRVRERSIDAHTEIVVSPEDDIELRRTRVTNLGRTRRTVELTSYAEVVLADAVGDAMHPAFSKLFVMTEIVESLQAIVCSRRPRSSDEHTPWMCHLVAVHNADIEEISYETDRSRFIGRGRNASRPTAMDADSVRLSGSQGSVLDPVVAIRVRLTLEPEQTATFDFVTGLGDSRDACMQLIEKYRDRHLADRVFDLAWTHSQVLLRQANATLADAQLYEHMATAIVYPNAAMRAAPEIIAANKRGQSGLWGQSVSGDLPIVLLRIADLARIDIVRQMIRAHAYWRMKGLAVDLVIWNEDSAGYRQELQDAIMGMVATGSEASLLDRPGGVFVRAAQPLSNEDRMVMQASARIVVTDSLGTLSEQIERHRFEPRFQAPEPARFPALVGPSPNAATGPALSERLSLDMPGGYGGFTADGSEYVVVLKAGETTPAPWSNVLANPNFGSVISESGSAYTWAENAHECRLTPWQNDPVEDGCGEAIYLRDESTGRVWSPTPLPARGEGEYITRHGFGYSVFEHIEDGIHSELWVYVALDASVKFHVLKLRNDSKTPRQLSVTGYVEWILGDLREKTAMHVVTETDPVSGALFARNAYNSEFPGRVAFFDVEDPARRVGGDRSDFIGRNGDASMPFAMQRSQWSSRVGAGLDPCGALQLSVDLAVGQTREVVLRLGMGRDERDAKALVQRFRREGSAAEALASVRAHWQRVLGTVRVETPEPALDVLANGWLLYQAIACRFWARSGYYQSGGAIGFRDQLQDSMAMIHAAPELARAQLLVCAAHQFVEGDVQHWWHPPLDRGVRTQCSDDYLWLPLATSRYVFATGDTSVLDVPVGYIEGRPLHPNEESYYDLPLASSVNEPLYRHCVRAIEHSLRRGVHGLPLMGSGDWNDGMNKVGERGLGESVWLGFFSCKVLEAFAETARGHGDSVFAERCEAQIATLRDALEGQAWDGAWYRRAYFDDGTPLGSAKNDECRIDSISQSWSVLSGVAGDERRRRAMESLDEHLVRRDADLIQLLDPPFDRSSMDPGYIKGYVPGVRENGGQYTHAAIWAAMAFADLGDSARAWELTRMINPLSHSTDRDATDIYKVEPYVITADVYAVDPHIGRGGWSWYTGSAGWMYRLILESLLGITLASGSLRFAPVVPGDWESYKVIYRHGTSVYRIELRRSVPGSALTVSVDGKVMGDGAVALHDDGGEYVVEVAYPPS